MNAPDSNFSAEQAARVLATLLVTPDEHLEAYRTELLGPGSTVPLARLQAARKLGLALAKLLGATRVDDSRLAAALESLERAGAAPPAVELETASIGDVSPLAGRELPFVAAGRTTPPRVATEVAQEAEAGGTVALGERSPLAARLKARSAAVAAPEPAELSLEHYAALSVRLEADPARRDATLQAYGLTRATHRELQQVWTQRLRADPQLSQRFEALVVHYRAWKP